MQDLIAQIFSSLVGVYFVWHSPVHTKPVECGHYQEIEFCDFGGDPLSPRILYVMNGFGHDIAGWSRNPVQGKIEAAWKAGGFIRPHVVSVGKKGLWWYTEKTEGEKMNAFTDWFESKLKVKPTERFLYGDSMGGHNIYRWSADFPNRFQALALSCPAMPLSFTKNPIHTGLWGFNWFADSLIRSQYAKASIKSNPLLQLQEKEMNEAVPKIYVAAATEDGLGFYSGSKALAEVLKAKTKSEVIFEEQEVTHCNVEPTSLAAFLAR